MNKLSKNFSEEEFECDDNCVEGKGKSTQISIVILMELVREHFGNKYNYPCRVTILDGNRCVLKNEAIQRKWYPINNPGKEYKAYSSKSKHMENSAADFVVEIRVPSNVVARRQEPSSITFENVFKKRSWKRIPGKEIYDYLDTLFPNSLGLRLYEKERVHADTRRLKARW